MHHSLQWAEVVVTMVLLAPLYLSIFNENNYFVLIIQYGPFDGDSDRVLDANALSLSLKKGSLNV